MSKVALASALGVTTRALQTYENDGAPRSRADQLAHALGVSPSFLSRPEPQVVSADQGFFRARRRATASQLAAARAAATLGAELYEWITRHFDLPDVNVPDLDRQEPEQAAVTLRAVWGRGQEPLPNLVQLGEANGVRVVSLPTDAETVDAFSLWMDDVPYVLLSTAKTAERSRFDLAHELGHLVLHSRNPAGGQREEQEADTFASALLMPRDDLLARSGREPAIPQILRLRTYYRVSAMALTRRLHDIGRLSDWGYRQNCVQLSQRGFRTTEPNGIARERSRVFATVFPALRAAGIGVTEICEQLGITPREVHGLVFGQVPAVVDGARRSTAGPGPVLRIV